MSSLLPPIHEQEELRHRIIIFRSDGTPEPGPWFPCNEVAVHKTLFACAEPLAGLPPGIFKVTSVAHQELRGFSS